MTNLAMHQSCLLAVSLMADEFCGQVMASVCDVALGDRPSQAPSVRRSARVRTALTKQAGVV